MGVAIWALWTALESTFIEKEKSDIPKSTHSENQSGGVTASHIGTLNYHISPPPLREVKVRGRIFRGRRQAEHPSQTPKLQGYFHHI